MAPGNLINPDGSPISSDDGSGDDAAERSAPQSVDARNDEGFRTDESWKESAAREKERLDEDARQAPPQEMPEASFMTMLSDFGFQAMTALGLMGPEDQTQRMVDLQAAKFVIDTLGVLEEKTQGNLTEEEAKTLADMVQALRMRFVEISKLVAEHQARQAQAGPDAATGGAGPQVGGAQPGAGGIIVE
jgi:hypothetical protein